MRGVVQSTNQLGNRLIRGRAVFIGTTVLRVGSTEIRAKRVILATGSRPVLPKEFSRMGPRVVTTDSLFELENLPARIGIVGVGSIGLEIGQALPQKLTAFEMLTMPFYHPTVEEGLRDALREAARKVKEKFDRFEMS